MLTSLRPTTKLVEYSIVCFFTREWALDKWLEAFDALKLPFQTWTELIFIIDVDSPQIYKRLLEHFKGKPYNGVHIYRTDQKAANVTSLNRRRDRIVQIHELSKELIGHSKYVFGLEDDTIFPPDAFEKMLAEMEKDNELAFIEGVQCGRHNLKMIGGWRADDIHHPTYMATVPWEPDGGIVDIDGGGFYCYMTPTELYKAAEYRWEHQCFGPDVCYGLDWKRKGLKCKLDYSIACGHITEQGVIWPNEYVIQAHFDQMLEPGFPEYWKLRKFETVGEGPLHG